MPDLRLRSLPMQAVPEVRAVGVCLLMTDQELKRALERDLLILLNVAWWLAGSLLVGLHAIGG